MSDGQIKARRGSQPPTTGAVPPDRVPNFDDLDEPVLDDMVPVDASTETELRKPPTRRYQVSQGQAAKARPQQAEAPRGAASATPQPQQAGAARPAPKPAAMPTSAPAPQQPAAPVAQRPVPPSEPPTGEGDSPVLEPAHETSPGAVPVPVPEPAPKPASQPRPVEPAPPVPPAPHRPAPEPEPYYEDEEPERHRRRRRRRSWGPLRFIKRLFLLIIMIALFAGGFVAGMTWQQRAQPTISVGAIKTQIADCSELATATLQYNGLVHYENGEIPVVNQKTFNMTYVGEVRAGVDLSKASVSVQGNEIKVVLPQAAVLTKEIKPESLEFFDQTWALFNWDSREDTTVAIQQAQIDLESQVEDAELIDTANRNAERAIRSLLAPIQKMNDGYRVTVEVA